MSRSKARRFADFIKFFDIDYDNNRANIVGYSNTEEVDAKVNIVDSKVDTVETEIGTTAVQVNSEATLASLNVTGTITSATYAGDGTGLSGVAREATVSANTPSGGVDGDVWYQVD